MQEKNLLNNGLPEKTENERLRFALASAGIGTWDLDPIKNEVVLDELCRAMFGFTPGEPVPYEQVLKYIHPDDAAAVDKAVQKALDAANEGQYEVRYRIVAPGAAKLRWVMSKGKAYFDAGGRAYRFAGTAQDITEAVRDREMAAASEQIAQAALEGANAGYFRLYLNTGEVECSPVFVKILTGDDTTVLKRGDTLKRVYPEDLPIRNAAIEEGLHTGRIAYEVRVVWNDGSIHWIRARAAYLNDAAGKPYLLTGTIQDTTEEHLQKEAVREAEDLLAAAFNNASMAMAFADFNGYFLKVNTAYTDLLGYSDRELYSLHYSDLTHPADIAENNALFNELVSGQLGYFNLTKRYMRKNGTVCWVRINLTRITGHADARGRILIMARDINQERAHEEAELLARQKLEEAQRNLKEAIEFAQLGTWEVDLATGVIDYSARMREWFGFGPHEIITMEMADKPVREADRARIRQTVAHAITQDTDNGYDVEYTVVAGGRERILHAQGRAFFNDAGAPARITGTVQDVTEQRRQQLALELEVQERTEELQAVNEELTATNEELYQSNERLVRSNEELSQYAYVASHDLQEPLRKIRTFSELLERQPSLSAENKPLIAKITQSATRMSLLIRDLLEFSRLLNSDLLKRRLDLDRIVAEIRGDFELAIEEKKAVIDIRSLPVIEGVDQQLNQLFYNLFSNALKFIRPGVAPHIRIESHTTGMEEVKKYISNPLPGVVYHHIVFADNGIGIAPEYSDQIFEIFKRLHARDVYPGTGIGLALCKRIVANHSGFMYVESEPGKGTTFHILLPGKSYGN